MAVFSITYKINDTTGSKKRSLEQRIKNACEIYIQYLDNAWIVKYTGSANDLSEYIRKSMDKNDHVLISQITKHCQGWLPKSYWEKINSMFDEGDYNVR